MPFKDPEKKKAYHRKYNEKWFPAHPESRRRNNWGIRGLDPDDAERLYNSTNECAICHARITGIHKHLDHNHATMKIRGVLCGKCNRAIGLTHENAEILRKAANYLQRSRITEE